LGRGCTGISLMELIHLPALPHLVSSLSPTAFAGCLPRPTSAAVSGHAAFTALVVIHSRPSTDRASLATSLSLIGLLTPVPPGDSASPPEVTHRDLEKLRSAKQCQGDATVYVPVVFEAARYLRKGSLRDGRDQRPGACSA